MGELVQQDDALALDRPLARGPADEKERAQEARGHGHRHGRAFDDRDFAREPKAPGGGVALLDPLDVVDRPGLAADAAHAGPADEEARADRKGAESPESQAELEPRRGTVASHGKRRERSGPGGGRERLTLGREDGLLGNGERELLPGDLGVLRDGGRGPLGRGHGGRDAPVQRGAHVRQDRDGDLRQNGREEREQKRRSEAEGADAVPCRGARSPQQEQDGGRGEEDEGRLDREVETEADRGVEQEPHVSVPPCAPGR